MRFDLEINGRTRRVAVESRARPGATAAKVVVTVDDQRLEVEAQKTDLGWSLTYPDGHRADAALAEIERGTWVVELPHVSVPVQANGRRTGAGRDRHGPAKSGEQRIVAPMPGRIVRILVKPGDDVTARQGLVVVEAMKMENELTSTAPGRVQEIAVEEGDSVEAGRLLVVVSP